MELPVHVGDTAPAKPDQAEGPAQPDQYDLNSTVHSLSKEELQGYSDPEYTIKAVVAELGSNVETGLSSVEAAQRLLAYGENKLEQKGRMPFILLFLSQFVNMIIVILIVAATVSMIIGELVEGIAVIVIILITVCLSTATEYSSGNALEALSQLTDPHTHVVRDGKLQKVRTPELVPGDIIELSPGDLVPADTRILQSHSVKVNEMILTGESADVPKKELVSAAESTSKLTSVNMVYSSTSLVEGRLKGIVLLTGMQTKVGSIAALLSTADDGTGHHAADSPVSRSSTRMIRQMSMSVDTPPEIGYLDHSDDEGDDSDDEEAPLSSVSKKSATPSGSGGYYDKIMKTIASYQPKKTPLQEGLHRLGLIMTAFALTGAALVVVIGIFRGFRDPNNSENAPWLQSVLLAMSMAVSAIPEGLPLVVTICLALGTTAMAKQNVLIRRLPAVETLGSASVICSDKTGTLTTGKMTVTRVWTIGGSYKVGGAGYDPTKGHLTDDKDGRVHMDGVVKHPALAASMNVANLCNDAAVQLKDGKWKPLGSSTEAALVVGSEKFGLKTDQNRSAHKRLMNIPFNSKFKMMATAHEVSSATDPAFVPSAESDATSPVVILAKGAPLQLLGYCTHALSDGEGACVSELTEDMKAQIKKETDILSGSGLRVLAMCYRRTQKLSEIITQDEHGELTSEQKLNLSVHDMVFAGLIGMMDPPRRGVKQAVQRAKKGGIRTVMITGDYLKTAAAIAEMVGILEPSMDIEESAVDCSVLRPCGAYLANHEIDAITWRAFVFARAKPEDKLQIVKSFQRQGFVCAMTGDGVNDAPALRQANIGVAMGLAGSDVAKAASDMILTDDKFSSIVEAVELGRTIYANLRKFVMYLIGTNWSQVLVILLSVLIGLPAPLEPLQILFVNLITDSVPAIALSIEKAEANVMKESPRRRDEQILSGVILSGIIYHASALVLFMLFSFFMGLWWETGNVLLDHMYDGDDLVETCQRLNGEGVWETIHDKDCVKDGLRIARTMVFLTIVFAECLRPLTARSFSASIHDNLFSNKWLIYAIMFSLACTFLIVFTPGVNDIFHVSPPNWYEWLLVVTGVLLTMFSDERMKANMRSETRKDARWNRLFSQLSDSAREVRNMRARIVEFQNAKEHVV